MTVFESFKTEKECSSGGGWWIGNRCFSKTAESLKRLPLESFCEFTKGRLFNKASGEFIGLGGEFGLGFDVNRLRLCETSFVHVGSKRETTEWLPAVDDLESDISGMMVLDLAKECFHCAKNDVEEVLGSEEEQRSNFVDFALDGEEVSKKRLRLFKKGEDKELENRFQDWIGSEMESRCLDSWNELANTRQTSWVGNWGGDTRDNYDIGEVETLWSSESGRVFQIEDDKETVDDEELEEYRLLRSFRRPVFDKFRKMFDRSIDLIEDFEGKSLPLVQLSHGWWTNKELLLDEKIRLKK